MAQFVAMISVRSRASLNVTLHLVRTGTEYGVLLFRLKTRRVTVSTKLEAARVDAKLPKDVIDGNVFYANETTG